MSPCAYCSNIPCRIFSSLRDQQGYHDHHESLSELETSASAGCTMCGLLLNSARSYQGPYASTFTGTVQDRYRLSSTKFGIQHLLFGYSEVGHFRGMTMPERWMKEQPPQSGACEEAFLDYETGLIQRWTNVCLAEHKACGRVQSYVPTRVIDVGDSNATSLRLVHSADHEISDPRYLALSHCWGLTMPESGKTKSATLETHRKHISYRDLPRTFRDFIDIARRLNIRYVWIDSLCIIQDSRDDWEKEAAQMADVYSKAYLTIAASGSANGTQGCRVKHETRPYGPVDLVYTEPPVDGSPPVPKMFRVWSASPTPVANTLPQDPLSKRGWTLQERELSSRVVHYSHDTVRWECRELTATLEFPCGDHLPFDAGRLFDGPEARPSETGGPVNDAKRLEDVTKQSLAWFELVQKYTARKLTKQTDKLPALSGLARMLALQTSDRYVAGLWESYFCHCLLWASAIVSKETPRHSRSSQYMAPSWSWASICGPVEYLKWINGYWHVFNARPDPAFLPKVIDISISSSPADPLGYQTLQAASLTVRGKVLIAYSLRGPTTSAERTDLFAVRPDSQLQKLGEIRYDVPLCIGCAPPGRMEFVFLLCCMNSSRGSNGDGGSFRTFALALKPAGEEEEDMVVASPDFLKFVKAAATDGIDAFRRVGVAWGISPSLWDSAWNLELKVV